MVNTSKIKAHPKPQESCDAKKRPANFIEFTKPGSHRGAKIP